MAKTKNFTETLVDQNGFEILVEYQAEKADYDDVETSSIGTMICTELKSVELVISGRGINPFAAP